MSTETLGALLEPRRQELHKKYLQGEGLAIGSRGYGTESIEIPNAIHVDLGFPSYDPTYLSTLSTLFTLSLNGLEYLSLEDTCLLLSPTVICMNAHAALCTGLYQEE
jgi:hypothetical protein